MEFLISESQLQIILKEQKDGGNLPEHLKRMKSFTNNMVNRVLKTYDINLRMFLTWGTSIAGLVMPLNDYLESGNFNLSQSEKFLVLSGIAFLIFYEGKRGMVKILNKIKQNGLEDIFNQTLTKANQLKESFVSFLTSIKVIGGQFLDIISYAFLIPIVTDIQRISSNFSTVEEASIMIAERLLASGIILISKEILVSSLKKIIARIK